jgi:hypothetical protein
MFCIVRCVAGWVFRLDFLPLLSWSKPSKQNGPTNIEEGTTIHFETSITSHPTTKRRLPTDPNPQRPGFCIINSHQRENLTQKLICGRCRTQRRTGLEDDKLEMTLNMTALLVCPVLRSVRLPAVNVPNTTNVRKRGELALHWRLGIYTVLMKMWSVGDILSSLTA